MELINGLKLDNVRGDFYGGLTAVPLVYPGAITQTDLAVTGFLPWQAYIQDEHGNIEAMNQAAFRKQTRRIPMQLIWMMYLNDQSMKVRRS